MKLIQPVPETINMLISIRKNNIDERYSFLRIDSFLITTERAGWLYTGATMKIHGKEYVWVYVTDDEYEFPIYITDSVVELARLIGTKPNTISSSYSHWIKGEHKTCRYRKVQVK